MLINANNRLKFEETAELDFYSVLHRLGNLGCSYLSYAIEMPQQEKRIAFFSDKIWYQVFHDNLFFGNCLLTQLCRNKNRGFLPWNTLTPTSKATKAVIDARTDFDIANGFTLSHSTQGMTEMIAFGGRRTNVKLVNTLLQHKDLLNFYIRQLRASATKSSAPTGAHLITSALNSSSMP